MAVDRLSPAPWKVPPIRTAPIIFFLNPRVAGADFLLWCKPNRLLIHLLAASQPSLGKQNSLKGRLQCFFCAVCQLLSSSQNDLSNTIQRQDLVHSLLHHCLLKSSLQSPLRFIYVSAWCLSDPRK